MTDGRPVLEILSIDDEALIDRVKVKYGSPSDHSVALQCGIDPSLVHAVRKGRKGLGPKARLKLFDRLGFPWARPALLHVFPDELLALQYETTYLDEAHMSKASPDAMEAMNKMKEGLKGHIAITGTPHSSPRRKGGK
jgi:hypothetical protein